MVNRSNPINGQHIDKHPFSDQEGALGIFAKGATVIAGQAQVPGVIRTPEGEMTFQAGDYILTDNPPTHAWPVRQSVFETTYDKLQDLEPGQIPTGEPVEPIHVPDLSVPPADVTAIKAAEIAGEPEAPQEPPKRRGVADSKSLGLRGD